MEQFEGRLIDAFQFASVKHQYQTRKCEGNPSYIVHPSRVMQLLWKAGVRDSDTLIAGLFHDIIEDTKTTKDEIREKFGENIANIVEECSDNKSLEKVVRKKLQITHASQISTSAKLIKLADKYSNLEDLLSTPPVKWSIYEIYGYAIWCYAVYNNLKGVNKFLEDELLNIFDKFGVAHMDINSIEYKTLLENYYENTVNSNK